MSASTYWDPSPFSEEGNAACLSFEYPLREEEMSLFFVGTNSTLIETFWAEGQWATRQLQGTPIGRPVAVPWWGGGELQIHCFFPEYDWIGHAWQGQYEILYDSVPGPNIAVANYLDGSMNVYYIGRLDGRLHHIKIDSNGKQDQVVPGAPANISSNLSAINYLTEQHVFYIEAGQLAQSWFDGANWNHQKLPGNPYNTVACLLRDLRMAQSVQHAFFVTAAGQLQQSWYDGTNWNNQNLPGSPLGFGLVSGQFGVEQHVFYVRKEGVLGQSWYDGTNWNSQALPGRPSELLATQTYQATVRSAPEQHVFFRADDGSLQQSWYNEVGWQNQVLPAANPPLLGFGL